MYVDVRPTGRNCWCACCMLWDPAVDVHVDVVKLVCQDCCCACWCEVYRQTLLICMLMLLGLLAETVDVHNVGPNCWCTCWCEAYRQTLLMCTLMALDLKAETVHVYVDVVRPVGRNCWMCMLMLGARIACWLERRTCDRKVTNSNPGRRIFFSSQLCVLTVTRCLFHPRVTAVACKRPW